MRAVSCWMTGIGTWNTRYADLTLAGRRKGLSFSLTGRIFTSDEMDLSDYEAWDFRPNTPAFYKNKLAINGVADNGTYRAQDFLDQHGLENHAYFTAIRNEDGLATAIDHFEFEGDIAFDGVAVCISEQSLHGQHDILCQCCRRQGQGKE